jgi:hypothetical protein
VLLELREVGKVQVGAEVTFVSTIGVAGKFRSTVDGQGAKGGGVVGRFDERTGGSVGSSSGTEDELIDSFSVCSGGTFSSLQVSNDGGEGNVLLVAERARVILD